MEEPTRRRVSFKAHQQLPTYKNGKVEHRGRSRRIEQIMGGKNKHNYPNCYDSLDIPMHTMEFLCRSWSHASSTFLRTFSSSYNESLDFQDKHSLEEHEEKVEHGSDILEEEEENIQVDNASTHKLQSDYRNMASQANEIWTRTLVERSIPFFRQGCISLDINKRIKIWLREKSVSGMFMKWRRGEKNKMKDEVRFLTAKIHAALTVTQLAAAIAGFTATNSMEIAKDNRKEDKKMSNVVAYSAALLASACAEAAESVGAQQAHIVSAVNSGLAVQTPADMITLTAATATSLRGAETLKSRAMSGLLLSGKKEPVKLSAKLPTINPSGEKANRLVSIHMKHKQLILVLQKKYFGVLTASKEYRIQQVNQEKKAQGYHLLAIKCDGGNVKLLFEDKDELLAWMSHISSFLES